MNLKVQVGTRRARLTAGFPEELWHIVMQGFCFCVGWWFAAMRDSANEFPKCLQGDFFPIPIGARVAYLPRVSEDRRKMERFSAHGRGLFDATRLAFFLRREAE